jgi:cob(I)alamin adenosyltransferase
MEKGFVKVYCGEGKGKSQSSLGRALICASEGKSVFVVQFLKGRTSGQLSYLRKLEPDIKFFRFEKEKAYYENLSPEAREEEKINIINGMHFARKVISIEECDVLVLDEVLGLIDLGIISAEDVIDLIQRKSESMELILTGRNLPEKIIPYADYISRLDIVRMPEIQ